MSLLGSKNDREPIKGTLLDASAEINLAKFTKIKCRWTLCQQILTANDTSRETSEVRSDKPRLWAEPSVTIQTNLSCTSPSQLHNLNGESKTTSDPQFTEAIRIIAEPLTPLVGLILSVKHHRIMLIGTAFQQMVQDLQ